MVISKHPLRFILTVVIACLPLFSFANNVSDSTRVHAEAIPVVSDSVNAKTEASHLEKEASHNAPAEPTDVKTDRKSVV